MLNEVNEVRIIGVVSSEFLPDPVMTTMDPVRFSVTVGDDVVYCIADELLSVQIQRKLCVGANICVVGRIISLKSGTETPRNYVYSQRIYSESESGFVDQLPLIE